MKTELGNTNCLEQKFMTTVDESLQQAKEGNVKSFESIEELDKYIDTIL